MRRLLTLLCIALGCATVAHADDRVQHGDWSSQFLDGMGEASTNEQGAAVFGMLCADGRCRYYFANGIDCESGNNYPMMLTTEAGALALDAVCEPMATANGEVMLYWFGESDRLNAAFGQSAAIGFAFPLSDGRFRLSKFSMKGYEAAIERMVSGVRARQEADQALGGNNRI